MSAPNPTTAPVASVDRTSMYKSSRWNTLIELGMVIPLEELPLDPQVFQQRTAQALYQIAKEIYTMRQEMNKLKESVQKARRQKKVIEFTDDVTPTEPISTGNAFDLLSANESDDE